MQAIKGKQFSNVKEGRKHSKRFLTRFIAVSNGSMFDLEYNYNQLWRCRFMFWLVKTIHQKGFISLKLWDLQEGKELAAYDRGKPTDHIK